MRNRFVITITDFRGARHYSLTQVAKTYALGVALALLGTLLTGVLVIYWLSAKLDTVQSELVDLQLRRNLTQGEYALLLQEHAELQAAIAKKEHELALVSDELGTLEVMIGLEPAPEQDIHARLDTASLTALEKVSILQSIPSGYPVEYKGVTSQFGYRTHPVKGERAFHAGVDLRAPHGTPVYATADGVVEWAGYHKSSGLGNLVILHHPYGFNSFYGHLQDFTVKAGDFVRKGDMIARSGSTGLSSGPHLHYEVRYIQRRLDPVAFMEWSLDNYDSLFEREGRVQWDSLVKAIRQKLAPQERRLSLRAVESAEN